MPHPKVTILPKFLNYDDEDYTLDESGNPAFKPTDARFILNIRHTSKAATSDNAGKNVQGNIEVAYPLGQVTHRCIAKKEDKRGKTVIYFLWAADGSHKIMRYHRTRTDNANPYGIIEKVIEYNFRWSQSTKITGIDLVQDNDSDLLYWTDNIGPRKINLRKASTFEKNKTWALYFPKSYTFPNTFLQVTGQDINGNNLVGVQDFVSGETSLADFAATINSQVTSISAEACDCHLKITATNSDIARITLLIRRVSDNVVFPSLVVPDNWYGADMIDRMFDQGKYPSQKQPSVVFGQDTATLPNRVKDKVWQFRLFSVYDDNETSVLNPISQIPIDNIVCNSVLNDRMNYIDINFNDSSLLDPKVLTIAKEVAICCRETNEGIWKEVARVGICDFFDVDGITPIAHYKFFNDTVGIAVAEQDVNHPFDFLPRKSRALKVYKNFMVQAGMDKDAPYDKPDCVDLKLTPRTLEDPSVPMRKVTFKIRVLSIHLDDDSAGQEQNSTRDTFPRSAEKRGAIMHKKGATLDYPFFGGLHFGLGAGADARLTDNMETRYEQSLPEGGWLCYAANTDYAALSKQINVGLPTSKDGALLVSDGDGQVNNELVRRIGEYLAPATPNRDLYSTVTVLVPDSVVPYTFRLASHLCSYGDKMQKGRMFDLNNGRLCHKTSTHVWGVEIFNQGGTTWSAGHEISVLVNGADVDAGEFIVRDLSNCQDDDYTPLNGITGYLFDALGSVDEDVLRKEGIPVHRAFVSAIDTDDPNAAASSDFRSCFTDHNGFFFMSVFEGDDYALRAWQVNSTLGLANATRIAFCKMDDLGGWPALDVRAGTGAFRLKDSLQNLYDATMLPAPQDLSNTLLNQFLLCTSSTTARNNCSTIVAGSFVDQNNVPVKEVSVVLTGGGQGFSDENGQFRIVAWGDMIGFITNEAENNNNRQAKLYFRIPAYCKATYVNDGVFDVNITPFGANIGVSPPPFSPTAIFDFDAINGTKFLITFTTPIIYKSWKAGGEYIPGIVYYDELLRQCDVAWSEESRARVPFITERNSLYGPALLDWAIGHTPPSWAHYYQLVMRRDSIHDNYLTWAVNDVKYIIAGEVLTSNGVSTFDFQESAYGNSDANMIMLDISNIADYAKKNFDTQINYTWKKGDKVRLVRNDNGTHYSGMFEYEVISFQAPGYLIIRNNFSLSEIKAGSLIQTFTPKPIIEDDFFFERGETFPCTAPGTANNQHSLVAGTFTGGDTYWRNRSIPVLNDDKNIIRMYEYFMECASISDFYESTDEDMGRVQVSGDNLSDVARPALMRRSDQFIPNTKINGLCRWRSNTYKELDANDGMIISLKTPGDVLHVTQENGMVSNYVFRTEMRNADNSSNLITSKEYFGTDNRIQQDFGGQFADGIVDWGDFVYGADTHRGIAWRRANNGVFAISEYKARNYWDQYSSMPVWDVAAVFDRKLKEYIVTIWRKVLIETVVLSGGATANEIFLTDILPVNIGDEVEITYFDRITNQQVTVTVTVSQQPLSATPLSFTNNGNIQIGDVVIVGIRGSADTIAFSETDNRWVRHYSFTPEAYESIGEEVISWKDGRLWIHDKNVLRNNFYGVQYNSQMKSIINAEQEVKMWMALFLDTTQANGGNDWQAFSVTNKNGQQSRIEKASFAKKEQYWHSQFYRDLNTPGVTNPIVNGSFIRSSAIEIDLRNDYTGDMMIRTINALVEVSERNIK